MERLPGEGLKAWKRRRGIAMRKEHAQLAQLRRRAFKGTALDRFCRLVDDDVVRSPDSDPNDYERGGF